MKQAIDNHNMQTAIHEIFIVNSKPQTTIKAFRKLEDGDYQDEIEELELWDIINANTIFYDEVHYLYFDGPGRFISQNNIPMNDCFWDNGEVKFRIIARFSI